MTTRIWTGTASVVSGYTTVVLSGDPLTDANCPADATIVLGGATYFVSERVDTTTVELTRPYEGVDDSAITAEIDPMSTTTTSLVTLSTQISNYDARLALIDANGRGLFYKSKGFTGADDPAAGYLGRNASDWADVTELYFDILDQNGQDISHLLDLVTSGDVLIIRSIDTNAVADFTVNALDDNTGWYTVTVTYLGGTDIIADEEDIAIEWRRIGGGVNYDAQTATEAGLGTYESQAVGYKVLVGNYQDTGRAAVFTLLATGSPSSWSDPAFITGPQGDAASVEVGTVSTLAAGASATVTNSGTESEAVLDFGIPQGAKGDKGDTGDAATIAVGTVTTLDPGESATVTNAGTSGAAILNFGIPKGDGLDYDVQVATIADREAYEGQAAGYRVLVTDVGDGRAAIYELITSGSPSDWSDPIYLTGESGASIWDAIVDDPGGLELYESEEVGYRVLVSDVGNGRSAIYQLQSPGSPSDWFGPIYVTGATGEVAGAVASVNGQDGIVVLDAEDIAFDPTGSPTGTLESTTVQDAIVELDFEKGIVWEVVAGSGISVDDSDPAAPVISAAPALKGATIHVVDTLAGGSPQNTYAPGEVIDGVTLSAGMIVGRFTSGGDPADGIFLVGTSGAASRHPDFDTWDKCAGAMFSVMMGDTNADTLWRCTSDPGGGTIDTDPLVFEEFQGGGGIVATADRTALRALDTSRFTEAYLKEAGREGIFVWDGSDLSAMVTADPEEGVYVAPDSDSDGSSGAWVRQFNGDLHATWFGLTEAGTASANTTAINAAIDLADVLGCGVALPAGEFDIDAGVGGGIVVLNNTHLYGQGWMKTILNLVGGGTSSNLRNYQGGAGIRRDFALDGLAKEHVKNVLIEHLAVVMNHPDDEVTTTAIQIGIDFRNITRSEVRHCWIGNYHPITDTKGFTAPYLCQGWAYLTGNESGAPEYAGGEVNTFRRNFVAGAWRAVTIDDNLMTPTSAAYSQRILENDIQIGQLLIYQASQYGAGNVTRDNILQSTTARQGDASGNFCIYITGYGNMIEEPYVEAGSACTYILRLASLSRRNRARFSGTCSATGGLTAAFGDGGGGTSYNIVEFYADTGTHGANSHDSLGSPQRMISGSSTTQT